MKRQTLALLCGAAVALIAPAASPVAAQTAHAHAASTTDKDVRCLIFSLSMASTQDQNAKISGIVGLAYYMGRLDAEGATADLQSRMDAQYITMKGQNVSAEGQACGQALQTHMNTISALGQHMQAKFGGQPAQSAAPATTLKPIPSPNSH